MLYFIVPSHVCLWVYWTWPGNFSHTKLGFESQHNCPIMVPLPSLTILQIFSLWGWFKDVPFDVEALREQLLGRSDGSVATRRSWNSSSDESLVVGPLSEPPPQPTSILRRDKHLILGFYHRFFTARRGRIPRYRWSWFRSMKSMKWLCLEIPWDRLVRAVYIEQLNTPTVPKMGDTADGRKFLLVDLICWIS